MAKKEIAKQRKRAATPVKKSMKSAAKSSKSSTARTTAADKAPWDELEKNASTSTASKTKRAPIVKAGRQEPPEKRKESSTVPGAVVHADRNRRTCIEFSRDAEQVRYVALDAENGLDLGLAPPKEFDERFKPLTDYPVDRAARLYVDYARGLGATERVMKMLGKLTPVNHEDIEMATKKKTARAAAPVKAAKKTAKKTAEKAAPAKPEKKATKAGAKPEKAAKVPKSTEPKQRKETAAAMFQELLMEKGAGGKCAHTDEQIFAKVQKKFGLSDDKKSYVKWYRNHLTKQGKTVPAAKE